MKRDKQTGIAALVAAALTCFALVPQTAQAASGVNCLDAPALTEKPSGTWTPTPGISINTWNFAQGVSHWGPEATRVSVASTSLNSFDLKVMHDGFPNVSDPYAQLTSNNAFASINTDFFDLSWPAFAWGPVINNRVPEYLPLTFKDDLWQRVWLKVVATTDELPNPADGYLASGTLQTRWRTIALDGVNLDSLSANTAVAYDSNFVGLTPRGGATAVVKNGVISATYPDGLSIAVPTGAIVIQALGNQAVALRKVEAQPTAEVVLAGPESVGYAAKGSIAIAGKTHTAVGVNLAVLKKGATVFTNKWTKATTPKGALTWVIKAGKVFKVFPAGSTVKPLSSTTVVQILSPTPAAKAVKVGAIAKLNLPVPSTQTGYKTAGTISAAAGKIEVGAINLNVANAAQALVFDQDWNTPTPKGAVTITISNGVVTDVDSDGNTNQPQDGQYVIQVPQVFASTARSFATTTTAAVTLGEPTNRVRTLTSTYIRSNGKVTVGSDVIPIGALNHNRFAKEYASVFDNRWLGQDNNKLTIRAPSSVVVRNGLIAEIYPTGANLYTSATDTVIQFPWMYRSIVGSWTVGTPIDIDLSYEALNNKDLITVLGRGTPNITDGEIVVPCTWTNDGVRPRTSIGWDHEGHVWLVTSSPTGSGLDNDGYRDGGSTVHQMAEWLKQLGATDAVSFDGGGSTWMMRKAADGPHRVDMADPGDNWNPWIRYVPISLGIIAKPAN